MKSNSILFVGCGDLGCRSARLLQGRGWQVSGFRRDPSRLPPGVAGFAGDYTRAGSLDFIASLRPEFIVSSFNPTDRSVAGYEEGFTGATENLLTALCDHRPRTMITVSSTRVYAESSGGWVDEASELATDDPRAAAMIAAERAMLSSPIPATVVRFAGIYGSPAGRLLQRIRRGELTPKHPLRYSNRIHRDDCAGFLCHLLELARAGAALAPVYNGVDDLPAEQYEVDTWLASRLGVTAAETGPVFQAQGSRLKNKRCSNRLLHNSGYQLLYPDFRSGYGAVLAAGSEADGPPG
jgi:nucleoside-diphosphate-sugar epimerase